MSALFEDSPNGGPDPNGGSNGGPLKSMRDQCKVFPHAVYQPEKRVFEAWKNDECSFGETREDSLSREDLIRNFVNRCILEIQNHQYTLPSGYVLCDVGGNYEKHIQKVLQLFFERSAVKKTFHFSDFK